MKVLTSLGADKNKLYMLDRGGVIHSGRDDLNKYKQEWALETEDRTLLDACTGADVFIGLSGPNLLSVEALKAMADHPIVFALSNPDPEIDPEVAREARPDIIMATGRSDYPNQINNVLGFPYIFRGALDVRATNINTEMKMAAVHALASIAKEPVPDSVLKAYNKDSMEFGPEYIIPTPLDPRLPDILPAAISQAAIDSGVAKIK
jgi:malate dehydrogenase (oxaloacetate-decarboxylating)(NADP+)